MLIANGVCVLDTKVSGSPPKADKLLKNDPVKTKLSHYAASPSIEKNETFHHHKQRKNFNNEHEPKVIALPQDKILSQKDDSRWCTEQDKRCLEWLQNYHWNKPVQKSAHNMRAQVTTTKVLKENIPIIFPAEVRVDRKCDGSVDAGNISLKPNVTTQTKKITSGHGTNRNKFDAARVGESNKTNKTSDFQNMFDEASGWKKRLGKTSSSCQKVGCACEEYPSCRLLETVQKPIVVKQKYYSYNRPHDAETKTPCPDRKVTSEKRKLEFEQTLSADCQGDPAVAFIIDLSPESTCCSCHELGQIGSVDAYCCPVPNCPHRSRVQQLHVAVMRGFIEVVYHITRLLPHQAFLDLANNTGRTALHLAVSAGVPAIARHLIVCGASPVARDLRGNTPLHVACGRKDPAMVTHLTRPVTVAEVLSAQLSYAPSHTPGLLAADLTNYQGETCVHVAAMAGDKEILQHLTWYGADVNAKECRSGRTALHLAVEARDPELVAHIVTTCRASVTIETYARLSPYQLALANGATGIATQLLDLGAPAQLLPAAYTLDEDDDDYEDQYEYNQDADPTALNGWQEVDDIRLAGVPVHSSLSAGQPMGPPPVSTAPHTINADLYF